jgi:hypothetical protein
MVHGRVGNFNRVNEIIDHDCDVRCPWGNRRKGIGTGERYTRKVEESSCQLPNPRTVSHYQNLPGVLVHVECARFGDIWGKSLTLISLARRDPDPLLNHLPEESMSMDHPCRLLHLVLGNLFPRDSLIPRQAFLCLVRLDPLFPTSLASLSNSLRRVMRRLDHFLRGCPGRIRIRRSWRV